MNTTNEASRDAVAGQVDRPVRPCLEDALAAYWDAAVAEGRENRSHDTQDGAAQRALNDVHAAVNHLVAAERERCAKICESLKYSDPCKGEEEAENLAIDRCVRAIREA